MAWHNRVKNRITYIFSFLLFCIVSIVYISACGGPEPPILLGFVGGLSGRVADLGISGRNGAILAVENINSAGGVRKRQVKLMVMDDKQDGKKGTHAISQWYLHTCQIKAEM